MIKEPFLGRFVLTWCHIQQVHGVASSGVKTFSGVLVDHLAFLGVRPLLFISLAFAWNHIHLFNGLREWCHDFGTTILAAEFVVP